MSAPESQGRKKDRRFHKKIMNKKVGYAFTSDSCERYAGQNHDAPDPICEYSRNPRVNSPEVSLATKVYCLCEHSPHGKYDGWGVCIGGFPMPEGGRCDYKEEALLEGRKERLKEIRNVEFRNGTQEDGLSGYVKWGEKYLVVNVLLEKLKRDSIYNITVLGILDLDNLVIGERGEIVEEIFPVPRKKRKSVKRLLIGSESNFLKELKTWFIAGEDLEYAYHEKEHFPGRIRIVA